MVGGKHICEDGKYRFVYLTQNNINGKVYIGQHTTSNLKDRYIGSGTSFTNAVKKYGRENFTFGYIVFVDTQEELNDEEIYWIKKFKEKGGKSGCYNIADGGNTGNIGWKPTNEWKENISLKLKEYYKLNPVTEESRELLSKTIKGHKKPEKFRKLVKERQKGEGNSFYGKKHSKETRNKMKISASKVSKIKCNYCDKEVDPGNFKKYHGENCKLSPTYEPKVFKCQYCGYIGNNKGTMVYHHWDNCKKNERK